MGGAATASCASAAAAYWNPAALARLDKGSLVAFDEWKPMGALSLPGDGRFFAALAYPFRNLAAFGLAVDRFNLGGIPVRADETKEPDDEISYSETMASLCAAAEMWRGVRVGTGLILYQQDFGEPEAVAENMLAMGFSGLMGVDVTVSKAVRMGLSIRLPARMTWQNAAHDDDAHTSDWVSSQSVAGVSIAPFTGLQFEADMAARYNRSYVARLGGEYVVDFSPVSAALRLGARDLPLGGSIVKPTTALTTGLGFALRPGRFAFGVDYAVEFKFWSPFKDRHVLGISVGY